MEGTIQNIMAGSNTLQLYGLLTAALFFAMVGFRELRDERLDGLLFVVMAAFFAFAHVFYLVQLPPESALAGIITHVEIWKWLAFVLAPVLIFLYLLFGLYSFICSHYRDGLLKLFFGLTLLCYLYMVGQHWDVDVKGILTLTWTLIWLDVELGTAH